MKRAVIYARVSTDKQTTENQIRQLTQVCKDKGWLLGRIYQDVASGSKGRDARPELDAMLKDGARAKYDIVMVWSPDRLGRSQIDLLQTLSELHNNTRDLFIFTTAIDTTTPAGKALFSMMGVFAEFEREMIRERVGAGLKRARESGVKLGRPRIDPQKAEAVRNLRQEGMTYDNIVRITGVPKSTVGRILSGDTAHEA